MYNLRNNGACESGKYVVCHDKHVLTYISYIDCKFCGTLNENGHFRKAINNTLIFLKVLLQQLRGKHNIYCMYRELKIKYTYIYIYSYKSIKT